MRTLPTLESALGRRAVRGTLPKKSVSVRTLIMTSTPSLRPSWEILPPAGPLRHSWRPTGLKSRRCRIALKTPPRALTLLGVLLGKPSRWWEECQSTADDDADDDDDDDDDGNALWEAFCGEGFNFTVEFESCMAFWDEGDLDPVISCLDSCTFFWAWCWAARFPAHSSPNPMQTDSRCTWSAM